MEITISLKLLKAILLFLFVYPIMGIGLILLTCRGIRWWRKRQERLVKEQEEFGLEPVEGIKL